MARRLYLTLAQQPSIYDEVDQALLNEELVNKRFPPPEPGTERRVLWGLLVGNSFLLWMIGYGTFVVYSWDVIEPIAYFISAATALYCASKFPSMRTGFSLSKWAKWRRRAPELS
jgi:hypothetical protein